MIQLETLEKEVGEIGKRIEELNKQISKDNSYAKFFKNRYEEIMMKPDPEKYIGEMTDIYISINIIKCRIEENLKELKEKQSRLQYLRDIILPVFVYTN